VLEVAALERMTSGSEAAREAIDALKAIWCVEPEAREADP